MVYTRTRKINDSSGKTYQDTRLKADGPVTRPILMPRSSNGAPMMAIPSSAVKQEASMNASAQATLPIPRGLGSVIPCSIWMNPIKEPMSPIPAKAVVGVSLALFPPIKSINAKVPPKTTRNGEIQTINNSDIDTLGRRTVRTRTARKSTYPMRAPKCQPGRSNAGVLLPSAPDADSLLWSFPNELPAGDKRDHRQQAAIKGGQQAADQHRDDRRHACCFLRFHSCKASHNTQDAAQPAQYPEATACGFPEMGLRFLIRHHY